MNLTKLFNINFLKQNLKKSKGALTLLVLIVPVLQALFLIFANIYNGYYEVFEEVELAMLNILGMYIIPVILSIILFGYVYKRNSVDFINSMPISRKKIFVTNYLTGILLIICIQVLVLAVNIICSIFCNNLFIPIQMAIDIFIMMLISYWFVFSATSLAMTVSGNYFTQIVVTMLILFLIPFISIVSSENPLSGRQCYLNMGEQTKILHEIFVFDYTMPFKIISSVLNNRVGFFSIKSAIKMLILSIVYGCVGIYLFNKRKMENVENSFSNKWVHLAVKGLTLVPMVFFMMATRIDGVGIAIAITLFFIYYIIYDFITNKKIMLRYTVIAFVISIISLVGIYKILNYTDQKLLAKRFNFQDIEGIGIELGVSNAKAIPLNEELDILITDENIIKELCDAIYSKYYEEIESGIYDIYSENEEVTEEFNEESNNEANSDITNGSENIEIKSMQPESIYDFPINTTVRFKLKNGKNLYSNVGIKEKVYKNILKKITEERKFRDQYAEIIKFKDIVVESKGKKYDDETNYKIEEILNNSIEDILTIDNTLYDIAFNSSRGVPHISFNEYKNHEMRYYVLNKTLNDEIFNIITKKNNEETMNKLKDLGDINSSKVSLFLSIISLEDKNTNYKSYGDYGSLSESKPIIEYLMKNYTGICDMNKPFYTFEVYGNSIDNSENYLYFNKTEELDNFMKQYYVVDNNSEEDFSFINKEILDKVVDGNIEYNVTVYNDL